MTHASFRKKVVYIDPQSLTHEAKNAKCILFQDQHFVALRFLDGQWEINFERYTHTWEKADLYRGLQRGHPYCQDEKGVWIIDVEEVDAAYYIASQEDVCHNSRGKDECGGSISNHSGMKRKCVEEDEEEAQFRSTNIRHNRQVALRLTSLRKQGVFVCQTVGMQQQSLKFKTLVGTDLEQLLPQILIRGSVNRSLMPLKPNVWPSSVPVPLDHLSQLHRHPRDERLTFDAATHTYFWDGSKVHISCTGLIHRFSHDFCADKAIEAMRRSNNWPRPQYMRGSVSQKLILDLSKLPYAHLFLDLLDGPGRCQTKLCQAIQKLMVHHPEDSNLLLSLAMSDEEIKEQWKQTAEIASSQGTWMHASFECLLNGGYIETEDREDMEHVLFWKFARTLLSAGAKILRTEWTIYASEEDLAGSIDLAARMPVPWVMLSANPLQFRHSFVLLFSLLYIFCVIPCARPSVDSVDIVFVLPVCVRTTLCICSTGSEQRIFSSNPTPLASQCCLHWLMCPMQHYGTTDYSSIYMPPSSRNTTMRLWVQCLWLAVTPIMACTRSWTMFPACALKLIFF